MNILTDEEIYKVFGPIVPENDRPDIWKIARAIESAVIAKLKAQSDAEIADLRSDLDANTRQRERMSETILDYRRRMREALAAFEHVADSFGLYSTGDTLNAVRRALTDKHEEAKA
jgi:hypothetical protein